MKELNKYNIKEFKNFVLGEFSCKCHKFCNGFPVLFSYDLAKNLQTIRDYFKKRLYITSGIRCQKWNDLQKNSIKNSLHTKGCAVDFYVSGISYKKLDEYVKKLPYYNNSYNICNNVMHYQINPPKEEKNSYMGEFPTLPLNGYFRKGNKGNEVKKLQKFLNWSNNSKLNIDGLIGNKTINEVKRFQKNVRIKQDGLFGKNSLKKAKEYKK